MNYNKYIINKKKKNNFFLLIIPLIIVAIIYFIFNSADKNTKPLKIFEAFKNINTTKTIDITDSKEDASAVDSSVSNNISYFLVGYYESEVNTFSERIIESVPSIKVRYNSNVFFLMNIMLNDEFNKNRKSIEENRFSIIQIDLLNSKINDKLMNSFLLSMKELFEELTKEDTMACKTEDFKNWALSLPKEKEDEENYEKIFYIRKQIADLKDTMILEDCIGIIQTIIN